MSVKVNGKTYESHVEAMDELKIDKKHIRKIREGLTKHGEYEVGKHKFVVTISPKKATVAGKKATPKKAAKKKVTTKAKAKKPAAKKAAPAAAMPQTAAA